ncbi:hypothetical protein CY34DRAFT_809225 [Suillus luteus UH-Slu-Lm8-n1]|uniref:Uncharacterized protein n=1 Tax=Suillus luteus UH-Slu-Lm8-n1 TaxID=930992 RepID=A0A0D0A9X7_9AGAM|nr:hypothetical protein CY34DRAFT_809225 [Suillus luteus UH-Slu-Lm8-n1]
MSRILHHMLSRTYPEIPEPQEPLPVQLFISALPSSAVDFDTSGSLFSAPYALPMVDAAHPMPSIFCGVRVDITYCYPRTQQ